MHGKKNGALQFCVQALPIGFTKNVTTAPIEIKVFFCEDCFSSEITFFSFFYHQKEGI